MLAHEQMPESDELTPERIELVREHLKTVLASPAFEGSKRAKSFLELVVARALEGRHDDLRERVIGAEMFGRPIDYDTANDAVVRVKATEVRKRLAQHYRELSEAPALRIELPPGSYVPRFHWRGAAAAETAMNGKLSQSAAGAPASSPAQEFVTITKELPDTFTVVLEALNKLKDTSAVSRRSPPPKSQGGILEPVLKKSPRS